MPCKHIILVACTHEYLYMEISSTVVLERMHCLCCTLQPRLVVWYFDRDTEDQCVIFEVLTVLVRVVV